MFCVSASFTSLLEAVVRSVDFISVTSVREICEDGSLCEGFEVSIWLASFADHGFSRIFWGCDVDGYLDPLDCAALQAVIFLQSIYGFTVLDYGYGGMMLYRSLFSSVVGCSADILALWHRSLNQGL